MIVLNQNNWYAVANITGDMSCPNLKGIAYFKPFKDGVMVEIEVSGLPVRNNYELFLVDIHEGKDCVISNEGTFMNIGKDYNPNDLYHPYMVGDMPYLFSNNDYAYLKFYTTRFKIFDIIGKLVIIHEALSKNFYGNYGRKIGCGKIEKHEL